MGFSDETITFFSCGVRIHHFSFPLGSMLYAAPFLCICLKSVQDRAGQNEEVPTAPQTILQGIKARVLAAESLSSGQGFQCPLLCSEHHVGDF